MLDAELLSGFQEEAQTLLDELTEVVERLEEAGQDQGFPAKELEQFAQRIDRIMGAAQTLNQLEPDHQGLQRIGAIAQLCKRLGYKAAETRLTVLIPLFAAFWADTLEVLEQLIKCLGDEVKTKALAGSTSATLQNRLTWLGEKVQQLSGKARMSQQEIDKLLREFKV